MAVSSRIPLSNKEQINNGSCNHFYPSITRNKERECSTRREEFGLASCRHSQGTAACIILHVVKIPPCIVFALCEYTSRCLYTYRCNDDGSKFSAKLSYTAIRSHTIRVIRVTI